MAFVQEVYVVRSSDKRPVLGPLRDYPTGVAFIDAQPVPGEYYNASRSDLAKLGYGRSKVGEARLLADLVHAGKARDFQRLLGYHTVRGGHPEADWVAIRQLFDLPEAPERVC